MPRQPLFICGSGGFAREVAWLIEEINRKEPTYELLGAISPSPEPGAEELPWLGPDNFVANLVPLDAVFVVAVGNPGLRTRIAANMREHHFLPATLVHPSASIGPRVRVGEGTVIAAGCTLTTDISIGAYCVINLHVTIGHDSSLATGVTLHPAVNLAGGVKIGARCELGAGAIVNPQIEICQEVILGSGAVVVADISESGTYVGVPAKKIK